jgi:hypothetical protein
MAMMMTVTKRMRAWLPCRRSEVERLSEGAAAGGSSTVGVGARLIDMVLSKSSVSSSS